ncbi:25168_t:CDS:1, partial [Cetraspora pellucida]
MVQELKAFTDEEDWIEELEDDYEEQEMFYTDEYASEEDED